MTKKVTEPTQSQIPVLDPRDEEIASLKDRVARAVADYQNLEARHTRDSSNMIKYANSNLLEKLLDVRDHLGMAAAAGDKSLGLIMSTFDKILTEEGISTIPTTGAFDPTIMECQDQVEGKEGEVISTVRLGYKLFDRVLRPARVTVGNGVASKDSP